MPFGSYNDLVTTIGDYLARTELEPQIADFIWLTENRAQRTLQLTHQEVFRTGTLTSLQNYIELDDDVLEVRYLKILTDPPRRINISVPDDARSVEASRVQASWPLTGYFTGRRLYVQPNTNNQDWEALLVVGLQHLGAEHDMNYLLRHHADYLLFGALVQASPYLGGDERLADWGRQFSEIEFQVRKQVAREKTSGGALAMRSDWGHP